MKIKEIVSALERFAPLPLQDGFDNAGLQIGLTEYLTNIILMTDKEQIWRRIAEMETPGFFITADIMCEGSSELDGLEVFIKGKITQIQQGITGRKFTFQEGEWRLHLTFFPTNCVVDERYALKNKFIKQRK